MMFLFNLGIFKFDVHLLGCTTPEQDEQHTNIAPTKVEATFPTKRKLVPVAFPTSKHQKFQCILCVLISSKGKCTKFELFEGISYEKKSILALVNVETNLLFDCFGSRDLGPHGLCLSPF